MLEEKAGGATPNVSRKTEGHMESQVAFSGSQQQKFLADLLDERIHHYKKRCFRLKGWHYTLRISIMLLGGTSTVLLGLNLGKEYLAWSRGLVLVFGALVTFASGLATFWDVETYWCQNRVILEKLRELRDEYHFRASKEGGLAQKELDTMFKTFKLAVSERAQYWRSHLEQVKGLAAEDLRLQSQEKSGRDENALSSERQLEAT
jgi:hypothetical protein